MAKLSGVKAVNETIEYNGDVYKRVEDSAQIGDIIQLGDEGSDYLTDGGYYEVVAVDWGGDAQIFDDDGDGFDTYDLDEGFTVFRKKEEPTSQYREVKRHAKVGERIRIINKPNVYKAGDLVRVTSVFAGIKAGDIAEVVRPDGSGYPYVSARGEEWFCTVELVCPVEKRFDK